jgi:hypothetical protein
LLKPAFEAAFFILTNCSFPLMNLKDIYRHITDYIDTRIELTKIQLIEKISLIGTKLITAIVLIFFFFFFLIFISVAAALVIGTALNGMFWGFLIVALFYLSLGIIFQVFNRKIVFNPILNQLVKIFFEEHEQETDDEKKKEPEIKIEKED